MSKRTPDHYNLNPEPIVACRALDFCLGNIVKYLARAGLKGDPVPDINKALHYLQLEREWIDAQYQHGPRRKSERHHAALKLWDASDLWANGTEHEQRVSMRLSKFAYAMANDTQPEGLLR